VDINEAIDRLDAGESIESIVEQMGSSGNLRNYQLLRQALNRVGEARSIARSILSSNAYGAKALYGKINEAYSLLSKVVYKGRPPTD
jgi:hypothetical protein